MGAAVERASPGLGSSHNQVRGLVYKAVMAGQPHEQSKCTCPSREPAPMGVRMHDSV